MKSDDHEALRGLLEEWFERIDAGETPTPETHCLGQEHLLEAFLRVLERDAVIEDVLGDVAASDESVPAELAGRVGDNDIISLLGTGGAGEVYLARQRSLGRLVALKVLRADAAGDARARRRLRREAEIAASLDHPAIVPIHDVGEDGDRTWIAMKWLSGPALDGMELPIPGREAAAIGAAVARALHEAHETGIIHRDVKPSNIMLDHGQPYVLDFGLARGMDVTTQTTMEGRVAGTLPYMSPEQLRSGLRTTTLDARSDVYSLGATLYELVTGAPPFPGDDPADVIRRILLQEPPRPAGVDTDLATILLRALDKDRDRRFDSAEDLADDLERYIAGRPIVSRPTGLLTRAWKVVRRNRRTSAALASVLVIALILAVMLLIQIRNDAIERDNAIERVERELWADQFNTADKLLAQLRDRHPNDDRVRELGRRRDAAIALESLLDAIQERPSGLDPGEIRALLDAIGTGADLAPHRRRAWRLAAAVADALLGRHHEASRALQALPAGRGRDAWLAHLLGGEWPRFEEADPLEHLFCVLAMRAADRPLADRLAEIAAGRRPPHFANWRLRLQLAITLLRAERHAEAYRALEGLEIEGAYPRIVSRLLLREACATGDSDLIRQAMSGLEQVGRHRWTSRDARIFADACAALGDLEQEAAVLETFRSKWPLDWSLALAEGRSILHRATSVADAAKARAPFKTAMENATTDRRRAAATLALVQLEVILSPSCAHPIRRPPTEGEVQRLRELVGLIEPVEHALAGIEAARARAAHARLLLALGRVGDAIDALGELDDAPAPVRVEAGFQTLIWMFLELERQNRVIGETSQVALDQFIDVLGSFRARARFVRRALRAVGADRRLTDQERAVAYLCEAGLANATADEQAALAAAQRALAIKHGLRQIKWLTPYAQSIVDALRR